MYFSPLEQLGRREKWMLSNRILKAIYNRSFHTLKFNATRAKIYVLAYMVVSQSNDTLSVICEPAFPCKQSWVDNWPKCGAVDVVLISSDRIQLEKRSRFRQWIVYGGITSRSEKNIQNVTKCSFRFWKHSKIWCKWILENYILPHIALSWHHYTFDQYIHPLTVLDQSREIPKKKKSIENWRESWLSRLKLIWPHLSLSYPTSIERHDASSTIGSLIPPKWDMFTPNKSGWAYRLIMVRTGF